MFNIAETRKPRLLMITTLLAACEPLPAVSAPSEPPRTTPRLHTPPTREPNSYANVAWATTAGTRQATSITGSPLTMEPGKPCVQFRTIPSARFYRDTLIQDACLEIPNDTTIVIEPGITLGIIATNALRIGKNVKFSAKGAQGARGERADFGVLRYTPPSDAEIRAACIDHGNSCRCPTAAANVTAILGHAGGPGTPGGNLQIIVSDLVARDKLRGLTIDVAGGRGGPPGESGRQDCKRGAIECSSNPCTDGTHPGAVGVDGQVVVAWSKGSSEALLRELLASCNPPDAVHIIPVSREGLPSEIQALNDVAYQNGWDRRSGYVAQ